MSELELAAIRYIRLEQELARVEKASRTQPPKSTVAMLEKAQDIYLEKLQAYNHLNDLVRQYEHIETE